uniref:Uncharacterized protein n=1 Tax=Pithovirus LCDPAC02 TaxID=2506601 RepID=A0A481YR15_9VIRU|nr:MAG: hypothetical protein LCDPAC02_00750 [Pithovirus LCDPAC02]
MLDLLFQIPKYYKLEYELDHKIGRIISENLKIFLEFRLINKKFNIIIGKQIKEYIKYDKLKHLNIYSPNLELLEYFLYSNEFYNPFDNGCIFVPYIIENICTLNVKYLDLFKLKLEIECTIKDDLYFNKYIKYNKFKQNDLNIKIIKKWEIISEQKSLIFFKIRQLIAFKWENQECKIMYVWDTLRKFKNKLLKILRFEYNKWCKYKKIKQKYAFNKYIYLKRCRTFECLCLGDIIMEHYDDNSF